MPVLLEEVLAPTSVEIIAYSFPIKFIIIRTVFPQSWYGFQNIKCLAWLRNLNPDKDRQTQVASNSTSTAMLLSGLLSL